MLGITFKGYHLIEMLSYFLWKKNVLSGLDGHGRFSAVFTREIASVTFYSHSCILKPFLRIVFSWQENLFQTGHGRSSHE